MARLTVELHDVERMDDLLRFAELLHLLGCNEDHPVRVHAGSAHISASMNSDLAVELPVALDFIDNTGEQPDDQKDA
jgi:hypothetical protein